MARQPILYVATGKKGVGKSYRTVYIEAQQYVKADKVSGRKGRPVVIFDTNNEYKDIPSIKFDIEQTRKEGKKDVPDERKIGKEVKNYCERVYKGEAKPEIVRVLPFKKNKREMTPKEMQLAACVIMRYAKNSMVVLEDINRYATQVKSMDMVGMIVTNRHRGQDLIVHLQSTNALDIRLSSNYNVLRMHHQPDDVWRKKNELNNPELMKIAQIIVDNEHKNGNNRAFVYVDNFNDKLTGVSQVQFEEACRQYVKKFRTEREVKAYFEEVDEETGKKKRGMKDAIKDFTKDRMRYIQ